MEARRLAPYDNCISGLPGHLVEDVAIDGFKVRVPGGATAVPGRPDAYLHGGNFGVLPALGLFVRHAKNVTVNNAVFEIVRPRRASACRFLRRIGLQRGVTARKRAHGREWRIGHSHMS
jgi:hypothetical protein